MTYITTVLADSPSVLLALNDSTTSFTDSSPNNHVQTTTPTVTAGQAGISTELAATALFGGGYIAEDFGASTAYTALTVEVWFKSTSGQGSLWTSRGTTGTGFTLFVGATGAGFGQTGAVSFGLDGSTAYQGVESTQTINDGYWHHVVGVFSRPSGTIAPTDFTLYIDGALANVVTHAVAGSVTVPVTPSMNWQIGQYAGGWSNGALSATYLSAVAVYQSALAATNIANHYNAMMAAMPLATTALLESYAEVMSVPTATSVALAESYAEVATMPLATSVALMEVYAEVIVPIKPAFVGWGVPILG